MARIFMFAPLLRQRWLRVAALLSTEIAALSAVIHGGYQIVLKIALYAAGLHGPDATLYWMMGTGIRNGLRIYTDIFDPKPPGMFLLSAASFFLTGGGGLGEILNVIILVSIPILLVLLCLPYARGQSKEQRFYVLQCALIVGLALALYNATIGGDWQTEYYGAFFGLLYVAALEWHRRKPGAGPVIASCVSFSVALLLKEPFLLSLSATSLLLLRTTREWIALWLLPVLSACVTYAVTLLSLHALGSYIGIYLHSVLGHYIQRSGPVWARGVVAWERIFQNMRDFSGWFPLFILVLLLLTLPQAQTKREGYFRVALAWSAVALLLLARSFYPSQFPWHVGTMASLILLVLGLAGIFATTTLHEMPRTMQPLWRPALALYLTMTAIGLGSDFHGQYFALAIPFYASLLLCMLRRFLADGFAYHRKSLLLFTTLASLLLIGSSSLLLPWQTLGEATAQIQQQDTKERAAAVAIDRILDACQIDRYYFLEDRPYAHYMRHSPLNLYLYTRIEHLDRYDPIFWDESFRRLGEARILIESKPYTPDPKHGVALEEFVGSKVKEFVARHFTLLPWPCAGSLPSPSGAIVLFRKDPSDHALPFDVQHSPRPSDEAEKKSN